MKICFLILAFFFCSLKLWAFAPMGVSEIGDGVAQVCFDQPQFLRSGELSRIQYLPDSSIEHIVSVTFSEVLTARSSSSLFDSAPDETASHYAQRLSDHLQSSAPALVKTIQFAERTLDHQVAYAHGFSLFLFPDERSITFFGLCARVKIMGLFLEGSRISLAMDSRVFSLPKEKFLAVSRVLGLWHELLLSMLPLTFKSQDFLSNLLPKLLISEKSAQEAEGLWQSQYLLTPVSSK